MINRRHFIIGLPLCGGFFMGLMPAASGQAVDGSDSVKIQWRVPRDQLPKVRENLDFGGTVQPDPSSAKDTKGLPLIYVLIGAVALSSLADAIVSAYRDLKYGGLVIEDNGDELTIRNVPEASGKLIVIKDKDGVSIKELESVPTQVEMVEALKPLLD